MRLWNKQHVQGLKYLIFAAFIHSFHDSGSPWRTPSLSQPTWISWRISHGLEISTAAGGSFGLLGDLPPPRNLLKKSITSLLIHNHKRAYVTGQDLLWIWTWIGSRGVTVNNANLIFAEYIIQYRPRPRLCDRPSVIRRQCRWPHSYNSW